MNEIEKTIDKQLKIILSLYYLDEKNCPCKNDTVRNSMCLDLVQLLLEMEYVFNIVYYQVDWSKKTSNFVVQDKYANVYQEWSSWSEQWRNDIRLVKLNRNLKCEFDKDFNISDLTLIGEYEDNAKVELYYFNYLLENVNSFHIQSLNRERPLQHFLIFLYSYNNGKTYLQYLFMMFNKLLDSIKNINIDEINYIVNEVNTSYRMLKEFYSKKKNFLDRLDNREKYNIRRDFIHEKKIFSERMLEQRKNAERSESVFDFMYPGTSQGSKQYQKAARTTMYCFSWFVKTINDSLGESFEIDWNKDSFFCSSGKKGGNIDQIFIVLLKQIEECHRKCNQEFYEEFQGRLITYRSRLGLNEITIC